MDKHTLRILEYHRVLAKLAEQTTNTMGRAAALGLEPSSYPEVVARRLQETREARDLLDHDSGMPLGGIADIREPVGHAAFGQPLTAHELLDVAHTVESARRLKTYLLKRAETCPLLAEIGGNIPALPNVDTRIDQAIAENGDVRDSATPELSRIRSQLKVAHSRLMDKLNSILGSEKYRTYIQEPIITLREGRYCIPVKAENRAQLGGIVHDASASGATAFIEPGACVELGNQLKDLAIKEEQEVARIMARLTALVGDHAPDLRAMISLIADLDLANAKALLAIEMQATEPKLNRNGIVRLNRARHPWLTGHVVPIDMELGDKFTTLIITGPNTGGKTVSLKTVGLLTLMTESGMQIPADDRCEIALFDQVYADIGDEQDIQQSLSTFSAHLRNIVRIIETMGDNALVLLDEVGAGTDPAEGAALAKAILEKLKAKNGRIIASTHYGELKEYAYAHAGVENAAVEFDRETLGPTYRILLGVPGSSHAFYVAGRLGLSEEIVQHARSFLSSRDQTTSDLLQQIEESRGKAFEMERQAAVAKREAEVARDEYQLRLDQITEVQRSVRKNAEEEARLVIRRASDKAEHILDELRKMNKGSRKGTTARRELTELRREVAVDLNVQEPEPEDPIPAGGFHFKRGDRVRVISLGMDGELLSDPTGNMATVQMGAMRATLPLEVLRPAKTAPPERKRDRTNASDISLSKAIHIAPELMLRAMRVEEAQPLLDKYIDDAYAAGLRDARIIHGKGTGALRRFVWDFLKGHPVVASFRSGEDAEGGEGATIVKLKE